MGKSNKEIIVRVGANTAEFNKAMKNLNSGLGGMQKQLASIGPMMLSAFSVAGITAFGKASFDAVQDQEKANKKLMSAVQGNVYAYDELSKQAENLRAKTGIEDDVIMQIQQLGISAGHSTDFVKKLTNASVQLSVKTGRDLQSSYEVLEKSMTGVNKGLKSLGPDFASLSKEQLLNGAAIDLVSEKYGTFAEDATLKNEILKSNFGELQEAIGYAFNEGGFSPALDMLNKMVLAATDLVTVFSRFGGSAKLFQESKFVASGEDASFQKFKKNADEKIKADKEWAAKAMPLLDAKLSKQEKIVNKTNEEFETYKKSKPALGALHVQTIERYEKMLMYQQAFIETTKKEIGYVQELQKHLEKTNSNDPNNQDLPNLESDFRTNNIEKSADLYKRYIDIRQKGEKILTESAKIELKAQEDAVNIWYEDVLKSNVDYIENKKSLDKDYFENLVMLQEEAAQKIAERIEEMNTILETSVEGAVVNMGQSIADLITGDMGIEGLFNSILGSLGDFLKKMGAAIIAYGIAMDAFKKAFTNPYIAIGAGVALAITGALISNLAEKGVKLAEGGIVPAGYPNDTYPALLTSGETVVPAKKLPDFQQQTVKVVGVLKAGDIYLSSEHGKFLNSRKG